MSERSVSLLVALFALCTSAVATDFLVGTDYTEWLAPNVTQMLADKDGAIYILFSSPISSNTPHIHSC